MPLTSTFDPSQRQILVNLGNRYVVFAPSPGLPEPLHFDPDTDSELLPRVADESEVTEARIAQTLRVSGIKRLDSVEHTSQADIKLTDDNNNSVLIDIKIREHDPRRRDLNQGQERLREAANLGEILQVSYLNKERLKLWVMHLDQSQLRIDELSPLDVWEKTDDSIFRRSSVVEEVEDWVHRVAALYENVRTWLSDEIGLRCEESRTVTMSEELMQQFAVPDREISVLDILDADRVIASFVPRGLWLIGSWGRIDLITSDRTGIISALRIGEKSEWQLVWPDNSRHMGPFDRKALLTLLGRP